ncbi:hypothetical protein [Mucilaginibacter sp.]|uniref:hypothetical protein n=1 Tax=Mucilaginibacter sp. TaxID=1882438 RepID=UPI0025D3C840|nr:hypothetical protein [Mucilaginibacter sp.]
MKTSAFFTAIFLLLITPYWLLAQHTLSKLNGEYSSNFGKFTIVVDNNVVTGWYEYYEQYDKQVKGYQRENVFFLKGKVTDGKAFDIITTNPSFPNDIVKGKLSFLGGKMKIVLDGTPALDAGFDIDHESEKSYFPFVKPNKYTLLTFIKSPKAHLYNLKDRHFTARKGYLVKDEFVRVIEKKSGFSKVLYEPVPEDKIFTYWVSDNDLLDPTADSWEGFVK